MQRLVIEGEKRLVGELEVHGAKNSALPLLAACVLSRGEIVPSSVTFMRRAGYFPVWAVNAKGTAIPLR